MCGNVEHANSAANLYVLVVEKYPQNEVCSKPICFSATNLYVCRAL